VYCAVTCGVLYEVTCYVEIPFTNSVNLWDKRDSSSGARHRPSSEANMCPVLGRRNTVDMHCITDVSKIENKISHPEISILALNRSENLISLLTH
jgi:hypothetical protein